MSGLVDKWAELVKDFLWFWKWDSDKTWNVVSTSKEDVNSSIKEEAITKEAPNQTLEYLNKLESETHTYEAKKDLEPLRFETSNNDIYEKEFDESTKEFDEKTITLSNEWSIDTSWKWYLDSMIAKWHKDRRIWSSKLHKLLWWKDWIQESLWMTTFMGKRVQTLKMMHSILAKIEQEIKEDPLASKFTVKTIWCYCHRNTKEWKLSNHANGLAYDINWWDMPMWDQSITLTPEFKRFAEIWIENWFKRWWFWDWKWYDPMHFEYTWSEEVYALINSNTDQQRNVA